MTSIERVFLFRADAATDIEIRDERRADAPVREDLLDACLGPARLRKTCERLRAGRMPADGLAILASEGERLVGSLRLWNIVAGDRAALLLGPLCVAADRRSLGLGGDLIAEGLARAARRGHRAVLLVGDAPYYERFGFERRLTLDLRMPGPVEFDRFLGLELESGALAGAAGLVRASGVRAAARCARGDAAVPRAA